MGDLSYWINKNKQLFYYFAFSMAIPSTVLYILEIVTIVRHKQFSRQPFYKLFCIRGITDILMFFSSCYGNRIPALFGQQLLPIYRMMPNWAHILFYYYAATFTYQVTNIVTLFMLINRFTAIAFPIKQKILWKKSSILVTIFLIMVIVSLLDSIPVMRMNIQLTSYPTESDGFYIAEFEPEISWLDYANKLKALSSIVFLLLSLLVNVSTRMAYKRSKKTLKKNSQNETDTIEKKMLVYAFLTFVGHAIVAIFLIVISSGTLVNYAAIIYSQYPWITDLCTLVLSSWTLLWTSDTFREQFVKDLLPKNIWPMQNTQIQITPATLLTQKSKQLSITLPKTMTNFLPKDK